MTDGNTRTWREMYDDERRRGEQLRERLVLQEREIGRLSWQIDQLLAIVDRHQLPSEDEVRVEAVHRDLAAKGYVRYTHPEWVDPPLSWDPTGRSDRP